MKELYVTMCVWCEGVVWKRGVWTSCEWRRCVKRPGEGGRELTGAHTRKARTAHKDVWRKLMKPPHVYIFCVSTGNGSLAFHHPRAPGRPRVPQRLPCTAQQELGSRSQASIQEPQQTWWEPRISNGLGDFIRISPILSGKQGNFTGITVEISWEEWWNV